MSALKVQEKRTELERTLDKAIDSMSVDTLCNGEYWKKLKQVTYDTASEGLSFVKRKHQSWFDENDQDIAKLIDEMHSAHKEYILSKSAAARKARYHQAKHALQSRLRIMKNQWLKDRAAELQATAERHDIKTFYQGLKAIYGPKISGSAPVRRSDGTRLLTDKNKILSRWADHFNSVLNQESTVNNDVIDSLPQYAILDQLDLEPSLSEVTKAIQQLSSGKSLGSDGIPDEIYKHGGAHLVRKLTKLFQNTRNQAEVPQEFKDASIVHLYKPKGNKHRCDNHRGILPLSIAGKILARVILTRIILHLVDSVYPESQYGF